jgi:hypothetical protein
LVGALPIVRIDAKRVFTTAYGALREALMGRRSGVLIAMLDMDGALHGSVWIRARDQRPRCAVVGRHAHCAVAIPWATELSLRHVAVLARSIEGRVEVRVLDLVSGWGFFSEDGIPLESITMDGTAFFQIGQFVLAVIVTPGDWSESAESAYAAIPEREIEDWRRLDLSEGFSREDKRRSGLTPPAPSKSVSTKVKQMSGVVRIPVEGTPRLDATSSETGFMFVSPQDLSDEDAPEDEIRRELEASFKKALVGPGGPLGELVITADDRHEIVPIGKEALDRGIVLGRYSRCGRRGPTPLADHSLSRIHLLVTRSEDQVLAYDTASANGSWDRSIVANGVDLSRGRVIRLGTGAAYVSWV